MLLKHKEHFYPHPSFLSDSVSFSSLMILMHHHFPLFSLSPAVCHKPAMPEGDKDTSYDKGKKRSQVQELLGCRKYTGTI